MRARTSRSIRPLACVSLTALASLAAVAVVGYLGAFSALFCPSLSAARGHPNAEVAGGLPQGLPHQHAEQRTADSAVASDDGGADEKSGQSCGNWQADYAALHAGVLSGRRPWRTVVALGDSGLADNLVGAVTVFYFALLTGRAFQVRARRVLVRRSGCHQSRPFSDSSQLANGWNSTQWVRAWLGWRLLAMVAKQGPQFCACKAGPLHHPIGFSAVGWGRGREAALGHRWRKGSALR
jgi:hypothetical protein